MSLNLEFVNLNTFFGYLRAEQVVLDRLHLDLVSTKRLSKEGLEAIKNALTEHSPEVSLTLSIADDIAIHAKKLSETFKKVERLVREAENKGKKDGEFCTAWDEEASNEKG